MFPLTSMPELIVIAVVAVLFSDLPRDHRVDHAVRAQA